MRVREEGKAKSKVVKKAVERGKVESEKTAQICSKESANERTSEKSKMTAKRQRRP